MIEAIEHVGLSVSDLKKSIDFYCNKLGFEIIRSIEDPELLGKVVNMPDCKATIVHLEKGSMVLELFHYRDPAGKPIPTDQKQADKGFSHLGFRSTDVRKDYQDLREAGIRFLSEPIEFKKDVWLCYFYGPDGEVCEIRESEIPLVTEQ